jgi:hypothetical protein
MLVTAFLLSSLLLATNPGVPASQLTAESCDVGEVYAFANAACDIAVNNLGDKTLRIMAIEPLRTGDSVEPKVLTLAPHSSGYLHATIDIGNALGTVLHKFTLHTDEPGHETLTTNAHGFAVSALDDARPVIDFGIVDAHAAPVPQKLRLETHDSAHLRITKVLEKPPYVDVEILPDGRSVSVQLSKGANWGIYADYVKLAIDSPQQSQAWFSVKADIRGEVVPASNPFDLGLMRTGNPHEFKLALSSKNGKDFKVGDVKLEGMQGKMKILPCVPLAVDCRLVSLSVPDQEHVGAVQGVLLLDFPEYGKRLRIGVWGMMLDKEMKIHSMDEVLKKQQTSGGTSQQSLRQALQNAVQPAEEPPPPGNGPLLKWSVANETTVHGYQIFRSANAEGPFLLLNRPTIPARKIDGSSIYQYRDNTAESGKTYWYYIGIVYGDGHKQQLSGPQAVKAK